MKLKTKRDWGWYLTLIRLPWFCVKILKFEDNGILSLQRHEFRNEFWFIFKGIGNAKVCGDTWLVKRAPDVYMVNKMQWHQFIATGKVWVLEIQFGVKCLEEDIERK